MRYDVEIFLSDNYFKKGDLITYSWGNLKVLQVPGITKWRAFLKFISFGLYKIPKGYKCKMI